MALGGISSNSSILASLNMWYTCPWLCFILEKGMNSVEVNIESNCFIFMIKQLITVLSINRLEKSIRCTEKAETWQAVPSLLLVN